MQYLIHSVCGDICCRHYNILLGNSTFLLTLLSLSQHGECFMLISLSASRGRCKKDCVNFRASEGHTEGAGSNPLFTPLTLHAGSTALLPVFLVLCDLRAAVPETQYSSQQSTLMFTANNFPESGLLGQN